MTPDEIKAMIENAVKSCMAPTEQPKMGKGSAPGSATVLVDENDNIKAKAAEELGIKADRVKLVGEKSFRVKALNDPEFYGHLDAMLRGQLLPEKAITRKAADARQKAMEYFDSRCKTSYLNTGIAGEGGNLMPREFHAEVLYTIGDYSQFRKIARVIPMEGAPKLDYPTVSGGPTVIRGAQNFDITQSKPSFGNVALNTNGLGVLIPMSRAFAENPKLDVVRLLTELGGEALASAEEEDFTNGAGSTESVGFRNAGYTSVTAVSMLSSALQWDDLVRLMFSVARKYRQRGAWVMPSAALKLIFALKDSADRPIWTPPQENLPGTILGKPYYEIEAIPETLGSSPNYTTEIWFGDWKNYLIGDSMKLTIETSTEAGEAFQRHQMLVKLYEEIDGQLGDQGAVAYLTGVI